MPAPHVEALGDAPDHARLVARGQAGRGHVGKAGEVLAPLLLRRACLVDVERGFNSIDDEGVGLRFAHRLRVEERAEVVL